MTASDADFLLAVLRENSDRWVGQQAILDRSASARGCGMTVHSRVSDLRTRGYVIENRCERVGTRVISFYRLVTTSLNEPPDSEVLPAFTGLGGSLSEGALARPAVEPNARTATHQRTEPEESASLTLFDEPRDRTPAWA